MKHQSNETPLILAIYRAVWLAVVTTCIICACAWADKDMRGKSPEKMEVQP